MPRPSIKQDTQVTNSDVYDDQLPVNQGLEPANRAASLEHDLNAIRSVLAEIKSKQASAWHEPVTQSLADVSASIPDWQYAEFIGSPGQVTFILAVAPTDVDSVELEVNGVSYSKPQEYSISGVTITWANNSFAIDQGDLVTVQYK